MRTLDLTSKTLNSDLKYAITHFPDGEVMVRLEEMDRKEEVEVLCRITNAQDLFILMQVGDILNRWGVVWYLKIYYLMSMRMDRVISFQEPFSLSIVANMIRSLKPKVIMVFHPHSSRSLELLGACPMAEKHPNLEFGNSSFQLCYPDKGAKERYEALYESEHPILLGKKVRDPETGRILSIEIANPEDYQGRDIMVIDDLCDAGGTFLGIEKAIHNLNEWAKLHISVFHMVNRTGIDRLSKAYETVTFTNSFCNWEGLPDNCRMINVIDNEGTE